MSLTSEVRAYVATSARGRSIVRISTADLYTFCDALDGIAETGVQEAERLRRRLLEKEARIRQLEANLEAAQRRNARMGR